MAPAGDRFQRKKTSYFKVYLMYLVLLMTFYLQGSVNPGEANLAKINAFQMHLHSFLWGESYCKIILNPEPGKVQLLMGINLPKMQK